MLLLLLLVAVPVGCCCRFCCPAAWLPGCLGQPGSLAAWLPGCLAARLPGCPAAWLPGCLAAWLPGWLAAWLPGCLAACCVCGHGGGGRLRSVGCGFSHRVHDTCLEDHVRAFVVRRKYPVVCPAFAICRCPLDEGAILAVLDPAHAEPTASPGGTLLALASPGAAALKRSAELLHNYYDLAIDHAAAAHPNHKQCPSPTHLQRQDRPGPAGRQPRGRQPRAGCGARPARRRGARLAGNRRTQGSTARSSGSRAASGWRS